MGTWCRPLPDGVACEDQRVAYNPTLGQGKEAAVKPVAKTVEVIVEPVAVAEVPTEVEVTVANPMKAPKKAKDVEPAKETEAAE